MVGRGIPERMKTCDCLSPEGDRMVEPRAVLRDNICPLLLVQTPIEIPLCGGILPKVVNDIAVAADP